MTWVDLLTDGFTKVTTVARLEQSRADQLHNNHQRMHKMSANLLEYRFPATTFKSICSSDKDRKCKAGARAKNLARSNFSTVRRKP